CRSPASRSTPTTWPSARTAGSERPAETRWARSAPRGGPTSAPAAPRPPVVQPRLVGLGPVAFPRPRPHVRHLPTRPAGRAKAAARSPTSPPPLRGTTQGPLISALRRYQSTLMSPQRRDQRGSGAARPPGGRGGRLGSPCPSPPLLRPGRNGRGTVHGPSPPAHARPEQDGHRAAHRPPPPIPAQPPPAATAALGPGSLPLPHAGRPSAYPTTSQRE